MDNEIAEVRDFIQAIPPFDQLPLNKIQSLINAIRICYIKQQQTLPPSQCEQNSLFIIRKGALAYYNKNNELTGKYGEGDICTAFCHTEHSEDITVETEEDTLAYCIQYQTLQEIIRQYPAVINFFQDSSAQRLKSKMSQLNEDAILASSLMNTDISQFYHSPVATITENSSIQQAAIEMTTLGFSCLVVTSNDTARLPVGIVTDKDLRQRCIAKGLDYSLPVSEVMTKNMLTINEGSRAYDALMLMTAKRIHHLPVLQHNKLLAMVTITDLMNHESQNAVNLTHLIRKASSLEELTQISKLLPKLQIKMAKLGTTADHVGKSISAITSAFTIRLIELAEQQLGKAPVSFAWLAAGSQAREEQFAHSDQDNALIISNDMKPEHDQWFLNLATFVSDGLATCGFIYCPGDIMATNQQWRQTQQVWHEYFNSWVNTPSPQALLNSSVFFDLTTVHGNEDLLNEVRTQLLTKTKKSTLFLAHLSRNALLNRPPLGFFRDFVLIKDGENKQVLDLKHNGIAPIVDLARIYALSQGISATNTIERLKQTAGTPALTKSSAANLIDAFEFLSLLRMEHQAKKLAANCQADNFLAPKDISKLEREHLKDAFKVIKTLQDARQSSY
ncbi:putative nucleotidyltransferase substrate binding domain-containing protein [Thalassotalea sp. 1_MG-2023]|uniref:putative nucleotidyltransferase substrate binding domain-containing protein n=1 Tax=Thalassotalea sp. 1_MG-2023 TaxID=3062680 RepID=UPI0026E34FF1|nr:putative nucleotidyltransferase substrate binding domain-containing protein [Thalassotalea sp. 1_MG-2023]MDO6426020.1 putative nucleotidyltransferase substrate binding domain-containing protein [Thalassotalea sp. 1_MG-2023]